MSHGTLGVWAGLEYFVISGYVYRANVNNPLDTRGIRQGARFECRIASWDYLRGKLEKFAAEDAQKAGAA